MYFFLITHILIVIWIILVIIQFHHFISPRSLFVMVCGKTFNIIIQLLCKTPQSRNLTIITPFVGVGEDTKSLSSIIFFTITSIFIFCFIHYQFFIIFAIIRMAHKRFMKTMNVLAIATPSSYSFVCSSEKLPIVNFQIVHNFFIIYYISVFLRWGMQSG